MVDRLGVGVGVVCIVSMPAIAFAQSEERADHVVDPAQRAQEQRAFDEQKPATTLVANFAALGATGLVVGVPLISGLLPGPTPYSGAATSSMALFVGLTMTAAAGAASVTYWGAMNSLGVRGPYWPALLGFALGATVGSLSLLGVQATQPATAIGPLVCMSVAGLVGQAIAFEQAIPRRSEVSRLQARRITPALALTPHATQLTIGGAF
ncbi:MAG: hypothetical protein U0269_25500 [Polyangiales bacterium]